MDPFLCRSSSLFHTVLPLPSFCLVCRHCHKDGYIQKKKRNISYWYIVKQKKMCYILIFSSHSSSYPRSGGVCRLVGGPSPGPTIVIKKLVTWLNEKKNMLHTRFLIHSSSGYGALVARLSTQKCTSMSNKKEKET